MRNFTICYLTNRRDPCFKWLCDGLCLQAQGNFPEVVVVDAVLWERPEERRRELSDIVAGRFDYKHVAPKPNLWQGPNRLTNRDFFAAANARNTGVCYASRDYVLFMDDLSVMRPSYLDNAQHAADGKYVVAGSYQKVFDLKVENGDAVSWRENPNGWDGRRGWGSPSGIVRMRAAGDLYGCSFGLPVSAYLQCNGQDEIFDGMGYEDCGFGICLQNNGWLDRMFYNVNLLTFESEELHGQGPVLAREDPGKSPNDASHAVYYGGKCPSGRVMDGITNNPRYTRAIGNNFDLASLRQSILAGHAFPLPTEPKARWFDGKPLSEL